MNLNLDQPTWSENVILADGDYIDKVAFNLIVNFERMIGRRIPKADTARWIDCIALDGGLREGANSVQVVFVHDSAKASMDNFTPGNYTGELDGKAFSDHLGEFLISSIEAEGRGKATDLYTESAEILSRASGVKRIMLIPNAEEYYDSVRNALRNADDEKRITVFAMEPMAGGNFRQEILGYSLMSALGIRADEISNG